MINDLKDISIDTLGEVVNFIIDNIDNASSFGRVIGDIKVDNGFGTVFYKPKNNYFNSISISSKKNKITHVDFFGNFNFTYKQLISKYGNYREHYSPRDNLYFYFFNENKVRSNFSIECRLEKELKKDVYYEEVLQLAVKLSPRSSKNK